MGRVLALRSRLELEEGLCLAEAYQVLGDSEQAGEILRRVEPSAEAAAARAHLAGGHSLEQLRLWSSSTKESGR